MKNKLVIGTIFLVSGLVVGNNLYNKVDLSSIQVFNEKDNYYLLQEGIYSTKEAMQSETRDLTKVYEEKNGKYYVYVGITSNKDNAEKIENIYKDLGFNIKINEINLTDEEFINNMKQLDILIDNTNNKDEILTIEEVVLSNFNKKILE